MHLSLFKLSLVPLTMTFAYPRHQGFSAYSMNSTNNVPQWQTYDCVQSMIDNGLVAPNTTAILDRPRIGAKIVNAATGPGVWIYNSNPHGFTQSFELYYNGQLPGGGPCARYGKADVVYKTVIVPARDVRFVPLPLGFLGHAQRSGGLPSTWVEFVLAASPLCNGDGLAHGSVSVIQGNDGPAFVASPDLRVWNGFYNNFIDEAPRAALARKKDGRPAIANTETSVFNHPANEVALEYQRSRFPISQHRVYVQSNDPINDVGSNGHTLFINFGPT